MRDENKTKVQLIEELTNLRQRVAQLEAAETERVRAEEELEQHREHLEELIRERTAELSKTVNLMAGRE